MESVEDPVVQISQKIFNIPYLYPWQRLVIASVLDATAKGDDGEEEREPLRHIAVLPTGAGKSLCWMLPAVVVDGISIAVFPLLSLMRDQERRLKDVSIPSVVLKGGQGKEERSAIWREIESGRVKIILANPEVLQGCAVLNRLNKINPRFLVIDETHTVSQWGESFRPACAEMGALVEKWNPPAVLALTATAGPHIRDRIKVLLFNGVPPTEALANPDRPAIQYGVIPSLSRFHILERIVREEEHPLIVFCGTRSLTEQSARILRYRFKDDEIRYYHAGLKPEEKARIEKWFLGSENGVLCATCAYGMGVDKKNVRVVVHLSPPSSMESYLQESGRAARDGDGARAYLIWIPEDFSSIDSPSLSETEKINGFKRRAMMRYAIETKRCRREILLESLGAEMEDCSGCDVCGGRVWTEPPEEKVVMNVIRMNQGRFRKGQMARILAGCRSAGVRREGLEFVRGFGALQGWELEDVEEVLNALIGSGKVSLRRWTQNRLKAVRDSRSLKCSGSWLKRFHIG